MNYNKHPTQRSLAEFDAGYRVNHGDIQSDQHASGQMKDSTQPNQTNQASYQFSSPINCDYNNADRHLQNQYLAKENYTALQMHTQQTIPKTIKAHRLTRQQLGGKNLIIRMLAEIYHVVDKNGQSKWEQLSNLVPISLYSRTTILWLNYLLTSSSATDPSSGMSADSRRVLQMLQKFHLQQQNMRFNSLSSQSNLHGEAALSFDDQFIVFQIVAHDYNEGRCRKIFNVKLIQPGTRLGKASDNLVYWKEHRPSIPMSSSMQESDLNLYLNRSNLNDTYVWGINFSSVNDAKLFYDICSLNLVDLDFNSDYLSHFTSNLNFSKPSTSSMNNLHKVTDKNRIVREKFLDQQNQSINKTKNCLNKARNLAAQLSSKHLSKSLPPIETVSQTYSKKRKKDSNKLISEAQLKLKSCSTHDSPTLPETIGINTDEYFDGIHRRQIGAYLINSENLIIPGCQGPRGDELNQPLTSNSTPLHQQDQVDKQMIEKFSKSRVAGRRYTGVETYRLGDEIITHHSARQARAQYANSKNMKEFLSLDVQASPRRHSICENSNICKLQMVNNNFSNIVKKRLNENAISANLHDVATTTDDLPLDNMTKKMMFNNAHKDKNKIIKSFSEEVINDAIENEKYIINGRKYLDKSKKFLNHPQNDGQMYYTNNLYESGSKEECDQPFIRSTQNKSINRMLISENQSKIAKQLSSSSSCYPELKRNNNLSLRRSKKVETKINNKSRNQSYDYHKSMPNIREYAYDRGTNHPVHSQKRDYYNDYEVGALVHKGADYKNWSHQIPAHYLEQDEWAHDYRNIQSCPNTLKRQTKNRYPEQTATNYSSQKSGCREPIYFQSYQLKPKKVITSNPQLTQQCCCQIRSASPYQISMCTYQRPMYCSDEEARNHSSMYYSNENRFEEENYHLSYHHAPLKFSSNDYEDDVHTYHKNYRPSRCNMSKARSANLLTSPETLVPQDDYDKTMVRSKKNMNRRHRSQSPYVDLYDEDRDIGKSIQNVHKLILEVQQELYRIKDRGYGRDNLGLRSTSIRYVDSSNACSAVQSRVSSIHMFR